MENLFPHLHNSSFFDEATLQEMLSFVPPADTPNESGLSLLLRKQCEYSDLEEDIETHSVSTTESKTRKGGEKRKVTKRKGRRKVKAGKGGVVVFEAPKCVSRRSLLATSPSQWQDTQPSSDLSIDPCDYLDLDSSVLQTLQTCSVKNKREAVTEIKSRMRAIEESIQQAKAVLRKLISQRQ